MKRKWTPKDIEKQVLLPCRRRCCICYGLNRDIVIKSGQIAHLDKDPSNAEIDNLAFLCLVHHDEYDSKPSQSRGLTIKEVKHFRSELIEIIDRKWKEPVQIGPENLPAEEISGRYVRESKNESAEIKVTVLAQNRAKVIGFALWGTTREYGPNMGDIEFEAPIDGKQIVFENDDYNAGPYRLELLFDNDRLTAKEKPLARHFGLNVSFDGEYRRLE